MALKARGFDPGPVDGIRGRMTDAAIVDFKRSIGFLARPYLGPLTLSALLGKPDDSDQPVGGDIPWLEEAGRLLGLHEVRNEGTLEGWMRHHLPVGAWWTSSRWINVPNVPWCGLFVATCEAATVPDAARPSNPLSALAWLGAGEMVTPCLGARMHFRRSGGGHVGYYIAEDDEAYHIRGGNQSNRVSDTRIAKSRFAGARWPHGPVPKSARPVRVTPGGSPLSRNEA
jgi:uncharacterized protein (TIGR02594 family)